MHALLVSAKSCKKMSQLSNSGCICIYQVIIYPEMYSNSRIVWHMSQRAMYYIRQGFKTKQRES